MKNVTIALDDETHRRARIRAAELGTSLSALVKDYLTTLSGGEAYPMAAATPASGVRDVQMPFHHDAPAPSAAAQSATGPDGQPYFVGGKWVWTKDGKPRKPGALKGKFLMADDFDGWPADILASFDAWPFDDPDFEPLPFDKDQLSPL
jgi:plasmid stability protein